MAMCREAAAGQVNDGLFKAISNITGLRSNGYKDLQPLPYFGNALSLAVIQPPSSAGAVHTASKSGLRPSISPEGHFGGCCMRCASCYTSLPG